MIDGIFCTGGEDKVIVHGFVFVPGFSTAAFLPVFGFAVVLDLVAFFVVVFLTVIMEGAPDLVWRVLRVDPELVAVEVVSFSRVGAR